MFQAAGAARRSAELGRQVGAAIATKSGSVIALGTNEVPAPGGGSYWEGDRHDHREYTKGKDSNRERQEKIATEIQRLIVERLDDASEALPDEAEPGMQDLREKLVTELPEAILARQVGDLTEFGRATHAEMSALIDAARRGVPVDGATIFSTTFPCHSCARHIIEAGIKRVVFIEPYAKSRALSLHRDTAELVGPGQVADRKVSFEPFVGVAPNRYLRLFDAAWRERRGYPARKTDTGDTIDFVEGSASAVPVFEDLEDEKLRPVVPVYRPRERRAMDQLEDLFAGTKIELKEEQ